MHDAGKLDRPVREAALGGPTTVVETACPLDCPDACSLAVTVQQGKVVTIDGSRKNPVTDGYICAKVRKFGDGVYGPDRLLYPAVRSGRKGSGQFKRVTWDEAIELVASRFEKATADAGAESILPYSYGGSNGLLTQDNIDAQLWRRFGTSRSRERLRGADRRRQHGALRQDGVGHLPGLPGSEADHSCGA
jgi:anaerobic selenocysteine-containing dehydrogenase